jgi:hypothetical protein
LAADDDTDGTDDDEEVMPVRRENDDVMLFQLGTLIFPFDRAHATPATAATPTVAKVVYNTLLSLSLIIRYR